MFGSMNEAQARCGHWVVWDTKAPNTQWTRAYVEGHECFPCQLATANEAFEKLRAFGAGGFSFERGFAAGIERAANEAQKHCDGEEASRCVCDAIRALQP